MTRSMILIKRGRGLGVTCVCIRGAPFNLQGGGGGGGGAERLNGYWMDWMVAPLYSNTMARLDGRWFLNIRYIKMIQVIAWSLACLKVSHQEHVSYQVV